MTKQMRPDELIRILRPEFGSGSGGGHVIQDDGVNQTQRANLNFIGPSLATDDAANNATIVIPDLIYLFHNFM